jgi:hypothetical protein
MGIDDVIKLQALRDLLGLVRALFVAWGEQRRGPIELQELVDIGKELTLALELATKAAPGTMGHRAALQRAEQGIARLSVLITDETTLRPVLVAATSRVIGKQQAMPLPREDKLEKRRRRG